MTISRARACCLVQLHAIEEIALAQNFAKSSGSVVSQRAKSVVSLKKKKKGHHLFVDGNYGLCQSPCRIYLQMAKFQKVFAGRTECSRGP